MKILCVIVLYQTKLEDAVSYRKCVRPALCNPNIGLYVYDNSPVPILPDELLSRGNIVYISDTSNPGVSKAYNCAAKYAKENDFDWLLLLDQDTDFQDLSYLDKCLEVVKNVASVICCPLVKKTDGVSFSPLHTRHHVPYLSIERCDSTYSLGNVAIINSGMLIKLDAFVSVGGYNEKVPLDLADYQFIDRLKKKIDSFYLMNYILYQSFSNDVDNMDSLKKRFSNFCQSAMNYESDFIAKCDILFLMVKRCLSLVIRTKRLVFVSIMFNKILNR